MAHTRLSAYSFNVSPLETTVLLGRRFLAQRSKKPKGSSALGIKLACPMPVRLSKARARSSSSDEAAIVC